MPRRMSFAMTTEQAWSRTKTVTRRKGWGFLRPGDVVQQVEKGMGLKKGEKQRKIHLIRIVSNVPEPLSDMIWNPVYGKSECVKEGFPDKSPRWFLDMYCRHNNVTIHDPQNRIEFEYLE
ncbi:MAG: hypothetical protein HGJ94_17220 [Desulfosarcina sp.]|nr:hypothetical protein [Desulfosarcina sp.]MBC2742118.1 hypothetical protein [Desulfosarcina sp.]MBC2765031.1 hypothetical protein [Desulfosarcina sp.]